MTDGLKRILARLTWEHLMPLPTVVGGLSMGWGMFQGSSAMVLTGLALMVLGALVVALDHRFRMQRLSRAMRRNQIEPLPPC